MPRNPNVEVTASDVKKQYLWCYNAASATLWFGVLARILMVGLSEGVESGKVYETTEKYCRLTQSLAVLEVVHSLVGMSPTRTE